uniref:Molybdate transporter 2 homolog n=1 Tax=Steinernema glaseri TaxID=37863 RepID=A0A1I7YG81_9BILA
MIFVVGLYGLSFICFVLYLYTKSKVPVPEDAQFLGFQRSYLTVYLMAVAGDWLQGPHVYALYDYYGMTKHEIEILFIAGFGSSLCFGTFIGSIADKFGRKSNCFLYAILYGLSCVTKHFGQFEILLLGRLLGGIATSILFSAFESWVVYEHNKRGFNDQQLSSIFTYASLGNSIVAIVAGVAAQFVANLFGFVAPFDLSLTILALMAVVLVFTWPENYGNSNVAIHQSFVEAFHSIKSDPKVLCVGLVQSLFEGAMYTFVLEWTPALTESAGQGESIPHGYIFSAFMLAVMIGSSLFKLLQKTHRPESFMRFVLLAAGLSLAVPIFFLENTTLLFGAFIVFEMCVGIFWPAMGYLRGVIVPETSRSTTMNFFRIPLNLIVIVILLNNLPMVRIFQFCVLCLLTASGIQHYLYTLRSSMPQIQKEQVVKDPLNQEV